MPTVNLKVRPETKTKVEAFKKKLEEVTGKRFTFTETVELLLGSFFDLGVALDEKDKYAEKVKELETRLNECKEEKARLVEEFERLKKESPQKEFQEKVSKVLIKSQTLTNYLSNKVLPEVEALEMVRQRGILLGIKKPVKQLLVENAFLIKDEEVQLLKEIADKYNVPIQNVLVEVIKAGVRVVGRTFYTLNEKLDGELKDFLEKVPPNKREEVKSKLKKAIDNNLSLAIKNFIKMNAKKYDRTK